ncbi:MAG: thiamine-phosphate kinase [SAR202 cluster bacterium]|nr:thiamine-phosphate kinase [SAR202 cluster bacterium]|tara:strand:- start:2524 stop:3525 length:1002 start_codon:yes stop_codon:yes gene_type:complete
MKLSDWGEIELINVIKQILIDSGAQGALPDVITGIGDDASILHQPPGDILITTDQAIENVHFLIDRIPAFNLGWRTMAINISDIAAMAGTPKYAVIALSCPPETPIDWIADLYRGIGAICHEAGVAIVGGDVSKSTQHTIAVTMIGESIESGGQKQQTLQRNTGQVGDKILVTGTLGGAAAGRSLLFDEEEVDLGSDLIQLFLNPPSRVDAAHLLIESGIRTGMDISDGLLIDTERLTQASDLSARIFVEQVPLNPKIKHHFPHTGMDLALNGGEDYELLFTARSDLISIIETKINCPVTVVGELINKTEKRILLIGANDQELEISNMGWTHF